METTAEEIQEVQGMRDMYAGISLPGVIAKAPMFATPASIAEEAFDIAEAMLAERTKRIEKDDSES